jgi:hypothetical protein
MYFRTGSDVADLSLNQDRRIDCVEGYDRLSGLAYVFFERQRRKIEDNRIKSGLGGFNSLRQGMCVIGVKKDWKIELFAQTSHKNRDLTDSHKFTLAFGRTNDDRDPQFVRGGEHCLQQNQISDVEMADCDSISLRLLQNISQ